MAIKLVLTDLDGTLLNEDRVIEEEGIQAIRRWKEKGGIFSFITGRPAFGVLGYAAQAGVNGPMVCCNGAELAGLADWENTDSKDIPILKRRGMRLSGLRPLMEAAAALGTTVLCYLEGEEYAMELTDWVMLRRARGRSYPLIPREEEFWQGEAQKVNIMADAGKDKLLTLRPLMEEAGKGHNVILYEDGGCEIIPSGCTKAEGMKELAGRMGISLSEIMVLGDNANDCEMLREAGIGVAVANGTREAREAADYICSNVCTKGVAEAMERFCGLSD